ncbi:hypothetical protein CAC02_08300, partial [Streptococcus gallolyticus]
MSKFGKELFVKKQKFSIRKFNVGVFSVLIGATLAMAGTAVSADEQTSTTTTETVATDTASTSASEAESADTATDQTTDTTASSTEQATTSDSTSTDTDSASGSTDSSAATSSDTTTESSQDDTAASSSGDTSTTADTTTSSDSTATTTDTSATTALTEDADTASSQATQITDNNKTTVQLSSTFLEDHPATDSDKYQRGLNDDWISETAKEKAQAVNAALGSGSDAASANVQISSTVDTATNVSTWTVTFNGSGGVKYADGTIKTDGTSSYGVLISKDLTVTSLQYSTDGTTWYTISDLTSSHSLTDLSSIVNYLTYASGDAAYTSFNNDLQSTSLSEAFGISTTDYNTSYSFSPWSGAVSGQTTGKNNSVKFMIRLTTTLDPSVSTTFTGVMAAERYIASALNDEDNGIELSITMATYSVSNRSVTYYTQEGIASDPITVEVEAGDGVTLSDAQLSYTLKKASINGASDSYTTSAEKSVTVSNVTGTKTFYDVETANLSGPSSLVQAQASATELKTTLDNILLPSTTDDQKYLSIEDLTVASDYRASYVYDPDSKKFIITVVKTLASTTEVTSPGTTRVANTSDLTDEEKEEVATAITTANPDLPEDTTITVADNGDATLTFSDDSTTTVTNTVETAMSSSAQAPTTLVAVADKTNLTEAEKTAVMQAVAAANTNVSNVTVDNEGNATITFSDSTTATISADKTVTEKAKTDAADSVTATNRAGSSTIGTALTIPRASEVYPDGTSFEIVLTATDGTTQTIKGYTSSSESSGFVITEGSDLVARVSSGTNNLSVYLTPSVSNGTTVSVTVTEPNKTPSDAVSTTITVDTSKLDSAVSAAGDAVTAADGESLTDAQQAFNEALATAKSLQTDGSAYASATQAEINAATTALQEAQSALEAETSAKE